MGGRRAPGWRPVLRPISCAGRAAAADYVRGERNLFFLSSSGSRPQMKCNIVRVTQIVCFLIKPTLWGCRFWGLKRVSGLCDLSAIKDTSGSRGVLRRYHWLLRQRSCERTEYRCHTFIATLSGASLAIRHSVGFFFLNAGRPPFAANGSIDPQFFSPNIPPSHRHQQQALNNMVHVVANASHTHLVAFKRLNSELPCCWTSLDDTSSTFRSIADPLLSPDTSFWYVLCIFDRFEFSFESAPAFSIKFGNTGP